MKHHPAWLAAGLLIFVVLACNLGRKSNNLNSNSKGNTNLSAELGPGAFIGEMYMAKDDGQGSPGDRTNTFAATDKKIHAVVALKSPQEGLRITFSWWIVDAQGAKNEKIKEIDYTTEPGDKLVRGHLTAPSDWPEGKYKVEAHINGVHDKTVSFNVY